MATSEATTKKLNSRQEQFALAIASGLSQAEAYRKAYPGSDKWKDKSVWVKASMLNARPEVKQRIAVLQAEGADRAVYTLADHLKRLDELSRAAEKAAEFTAAVKAEEARGRAAGFILSKVELTGKGGGPIETKQTRDLTNEELAAELAKHGIQP